MSGVWPIGTVDVLVEVGDERRRQEAKWGQQNHRDGTGPDVLDVGDASELMSHIEAEHGVAEWARDRCERLHAMGLGTYEQILTEEWAEAIECDDPAELRDELVQVAAVAVAWIEKIDRDASGSAA